MVDVDADVNADVCVHVDVVCNMTNRCANIAPSTYNSDKIIIANNNMSDVKSKFGSK